MDTKVIKILTPYIVGLPNEDRSKIVTQLQALKTTKHDKLIEDIRIGSIPTLSISELKYATRELIVDGVPTDDPKEAQKRIEAIKDPQQYLKYYIANETDRDIKEDLMMLVIELEEARLALFGETIRSRNKNTDSPFLFAYAHDPQGDYEHLIAIATKYYWENNKNLSGVDLCEDVEIALDKICSTNLSYEEVWEATIAIEGPDLTEFLKRLRANKDWEESPGVLTELKKMI